MPREFEIKPSPLRQSRTASEFSVRGSWTPALTCTFAGNLSVSYSIQRGYYYRIFDMVDVWFAIAITEITHSTANGELFITGLPFTNVDLGNFNTHNVGTMYQGDFNIVNATMISPVISAGLNTISFVHSNFLGSDAELVTIDDIPTLSAPLILGHIRYITAD